ncbi:MAG: hypothetical protein ABDH25_05860 [Dictyoglomaceae bacterium]
MAKKVMMVKRNFIYLGILLISSSQLYFSLLLTRFFSISQGYHWAFFVIGLALLGSGASGTLLSLQKAFNKEKLLKIIHLSALFSPLSIFFSYFFNNTFAFDPYLLPWYPQQFILWILNFIILLISFFLIGLIIVSVLSLFPEISSKIYGLTFLGGSFGIILLNLILPKIDEFSSLIFLIILSLLGAIFLSSHKKFFKIEIILLFFFILLFFTKFFYIPIKFSPYKDLEQVKRYPQTEILETKRNAFTRFDLIKSPVIRFAPGLSYKFTGEISYTFGFTIDGENIKGIIKENGFTDYLPQSSCFLLLKDPKVLIIEPSGGLDIVLSREKGAKEILGVTDNPFIGELLKSNFQDLKIIVENPRVFLKRIKEKFDLIIFSLKESFHVITSGSYSLNENYLYTKESIKDSFSLLMPSGILCFTRWLQRPPTEELRLFITIYYALRDLGIKSIEKHIIAFRSLNTMTILVKKSPFTQDDIKRIKDFLFEKAFDLVYYFNIKEEEINKFCVLPQEIYYENIIKFLEKKEEFIRKYPFRIDPPFDDKPFFFHFFKSSQIPEILENWGKTWQPFGGAGFIIIFLILLFVIIFSFLLILLPLIIRGKSFPKNIKILRIFLYFSTIGLCYLFVEIPLMQKFILYLNQPIYSFSVILSSLLLFSGIGSIFSKKIKRFFPYTLFLLGFLLILSPFLLSYIIENTLLYPFFIRILISLFFVGILGFLMGIPFPTGLEISRKYSEELIPWVYAINGFFSVISSFSSSLISLSFGFSFVILIAGILYIISGILLSSL